MSDVETALTPISQARQMLAQARTVPEFRELRDFATAAKAWAKARGLGIEAENEATEVVLRAERNIGLIILQAKDDERFGNFGVGRVHAGVPRGESTSRAMQMLVESGEVITRESLGLKSNEAANFQRLAQLDDERFEAMIRSVRALPGVRLAKTNFYAAMDKAERVRQGRPYEEPNPNNSDFDRLRSGAFGLLGWEVDENGREGPTRNDLTKLPDDQLRQLASIIKALAVAYNEAKGMRDG